MLIRDVLVASALGVFGCVGAAHANSCANVNVIGTFDESGLEESEFGIYAIGTFRIAGEESESKQPMFNLAKINCEKQSDDAGRMNLECKVTRAVVWATADKPDQDKPNCSLDLDASSFSMKEFQKGVLAGAESSASCFNSMLTIDKNTKRIYMSFTRTKFADNYDKTMPGTCGVLPRTQVLMNCTAYPKTRAHGQTPPRYCDFSSARDK